MLQAIRNQPINFLRIRESESCSCEDRKTQCRLMNRAVDRISFQFKNPANDIRSQLALCDAGTLVYSNTFISNADFNVTNMTHDAVNNKFDKLAGSSGDIRKTVNIFTSGKTYKIRVKIGNITVAADEFRFEKVGSLTPISGFFPDVEGWIEVIFVSDGTNIQLSVYHGGAESIEDWEVYEIASGVTIPANWTQVESDTPLSCGVKWCHSTSATTDALISPFNIASGKRYRINIRITNATTGAVTLSCGSYTEAFTSNGYFTRWIDATASGYLTFTAEDIFDGCVEVVEFGEQQKSHAFTLKDLNDVYIKDLTPYGVAINDHYSVSVFLSGSLNVLQGCYKICGYDGSEIFSEAGDVTFGAMDFNTDSNITTTGDVSVVTSVGRLFIKGGGTMDAILPAPLVDQGCYLLEVIFRSYPDTYIQPVNMYIEFAGVTIFEPPQILPSSAGRYLIPFIAASADNHLHLYANAGFGNDAELESIRIFKDPSCGITGTPTYCSDCLAVQDDTPCTKVISADMDFPIGDNGWPLIKSAYGFLFDGVFIPQMRVKGEFHSFKYPYDGDNQVDNEGSHHINAAELQKEWIFSMSQLTESDQDALRMMIRCDQLIITDNLLYASDDETYYCASKDLSAVWVKKEKPTTADIEIEVQKRFKEAIFNRNSYRQTII